MKRVEIYEFVSGKQQKMGDIILDDLGRLTATPGIAEKILNSFSDDGQRLITKHEPEAFLNSLRSRYRSPYLKASIPIDVDSSENLLDKNNLPQQTLPNLNQIPAKE